MQAKMLKNVIYGGAVREAGSQAEIDDVTFYVMEKRGLVEPVHKLSESEVAEALPTLDEVVSKRKK